MRPISDELYGIPRERVIGSATALEYVTDEHGGAIMRRPDADYLDDGPQKPVRIWSRVGISIKHDWATVFPFASAGPENLT